MRKHLINFFARICNQYRDGKISILFRKKAVLDQNHHASDALLSDSFNRKNLYSLGSQLISDRKNPGNDDSQASPVGSNGSLV
jgi:hypothetical protein